MPEEQDAPPEPPLPVQEVAPGVSVKKPEGHATQTAGELAREMELAVLMGQGVGRPEPAGQYEPAGQAAFEQDAAPIPWENVPSVQLVHAAKDVLPVFGLNFPAAQLVHKVAPTTALKVPAAQSVQQQAPEAEKAPGAQPILRMRWLPESATMTLPLLSTATPLGELNEAPAPVPSANVADPLPASVVTTPPGVTLRMRSLPQSATLTLPLLSTATPLG